MLIAWNIRRIDQGKQHEWDKIKFVHKDHK